MNEVAEVLMFQVREMLRLAAITELSDKDHADYYGSVAAECLETTILCDQGDVNGSAIDSKSDCPICDVIIGHSNIYPNRSK